MVRKKTPSRSQTRKSSNHSWWILFVYNENRTNPYSTGMACIAKKETLATDGHQPMERVPGGYGVGTATVLKPAGPVER